MIAIAWRSILACLLLATAALAQPVTVVVPFPAGGSADSIGRFLAQGLSNRKIDSIVENRPGVGGTIGSGAVARAAGNGKTVLVGQIGSHVLAPISRTDLPYHPAKDFKPVILLGYVPTLFVVRPGLAVDSLKAFVDAARTANPPFTFGSSGVGTSGHATVEMLKAMAGIPMTHVPYRGVAPVMTDMIGGRIDAIIVEAPGVMGQLANGLKPLVVVGPDRSSLLPDVPTTAEAGFPNWNVQSWYGVFAPASTPEAVRAELERTFTAVIRDPATAGKLKEAGLSRPGSSADLQALLDREFDRWPGIFRDLKILE